MPITKLRAMSINKVKKYTFSGHESFPCKTLWLKKGYDFVVAGNDFNSPEAVIGLGVGKNMVASIRFWSILFSQKMQRFIRCSSVVFNVSAPILRESKC